MPKQYSERETRELIEAYSENPCLETVDVLSVRFNKTRKSIIAKLSKEGVYQTLGYRTKRGEVPITKLEMVRSIESALDCEFPGLDKTPKPTLKNLMSLINDTMYNFEEALAELSGLRENARIAEDMRGIKKRSISMSTADLGFDPSILANK